MDIAAKVYEVIGRVMNEPIEKVGADSSPDTIPQWDSLKQINLVLALEQEFDVSFSEEQIVELLSAGIIVETVKELRPED